MDRRVRPILLASIALSFIAADVSAQTKPKPIPAPSIAPPRHHPLQHEALVQPDSRTTPNIEPRPGALTAKPGAPSNSQPLPPGLLMSSFTLGDIGFKDGIRFANLGGRRDIFLPLPQGTAITAHELILTVDDISAHEARRSLEILVNDRSAAAVALDGNSSGRVIRIPLAGAKARDGFLKLTFQYSGAATPDRCIDVRYVGDSLTIRPETSLEIGIDFGKSGPDVATTAALMPRDVAILLPAGRLSSNDFSTALTVGRAMGASGRRVTFHTGLETLPFLAKRTDQRWTRGIIVIGSFESIASSIESWPIKVAGAGPTFGTLASVKVAGEPVLVVADQEAVRAGRLFGRPAIAATRGLPAATIGSSVIRQLPTAQVTFEQLGIELPQAEVFGRAELKATIDQRALPPNTQPTRLLLDLMIAPDDTGEKAVASVYVNEQILASKVASLNEPTRFDLTLPDGLVGLTANIRILVQRRSVQGDCRFEPQGYPAHLLGSSSVVLSASSIPAEDFFNLPSRWANGVELLIPTAASERPLQLMGLLTDVLTVLTPVSSAITTRFVDAGAAPAPTGPFLAIGNRLPTGAFAHVRFDLGRVVVTDRAGATLLDLGGFGQGAVAQVVTASNYSGLWIKPLDAEGALPTPAELRLDRGNVAFIDKAGLALAMSTERDTLVRVSYPDEVSWLTVADRFRSWIIGAFWLLATFGFLFLLQRFLRRRAATMNDAGE